MKCIISRIYSFTINCSVFDKTYFSAAKTFKASKRIYMVLVPIMVIQYFVFLPGGFQQHSAFHNEVKFFLSISIIFLYCDSFIFVHAVKCSWNKNSFSIKQFKRILSIGG